MICQIGYRIDELKYEKWEARAVRLVWKLVDVRGMKREKFAFLDVEMDMVVCADISVARYEGDLRWIKGR